MRVLKISAETLILFLQENPTLAALTSHIQYINIRGEYI